MATQRILQPEPLRLEGTVDVALGQEDRRERQRLEDEVRSLQRRLEDVTEKQDRLERAQQNIRTILQPLYNGLRVLFGELELSIGENGAAAPANPPNPSWKSGDPRIESFKATFPGRPAEILDALQTHGEMKFSHLAGLLRCDVRTIYKAADKLKKAGAVTSAGGVLTLKS